MVAKVPLSVGPRFPQAMAPFGVTGELARRKLLPGLAAVGLTPVYSIVRISLDKLDADGCRRFIRLAIGGFSRRLVTEPCAQRRPVERAWRARHYPANS